MKTLQFILFAILGAASALLPIYFGDLRTLEQFLVADILSSLVTVLIVFSYNFATSAKVEAKGTFKTGLPVFINVIAASVGALIMVGIMTIIA